MKHLPMTDSAAQPERIPSLVWLILGASFWIKCAAYFTVPYLAVFLTRQTALSPVTIGLVIGLQPLAAMIGGFVGGHLSDRWGRARMLQASLFGSALTYLGFYIVASRAAGAPYAWLAFAALNLLAGTTGAPFWPSTQALIADSLSERQRPVVYRMRYVFANIGGGLGPLLSITLGIAAAAKAFLITALSYALFLALFAAILARQSSAFPCTDPPRSLRAALTVLRRDRALRWLLLSAVLFGIGYSQIESNLSQLMARVIIPDGLQFYSWMLTLNAFGVVALQPLANRIERHLAASAMMSLGTAVFCVACTVMAALPSSKSALILGIVVITIGEIMVVPTLSVLIDELAPIGMRGSYFGAAMLRQLGPTLGPALGGMIISGAGATGLFTLMAVAGALAAMCVHFAGRRE